MRCSNARPCSRLDAARSPEGEWQLAQAPAKYCGPLLDHQSADRRRPRCGGRRSATRLRFLVVDERDDRTQIRGAQRERRHALVHATAAQQRPQLVAPHVFGDERGASGRDPIRHPSRRGRGEAALRGEEALACRDLIRGYVCVVVDFGGGTDAGLACPRPCACRSEPRRLTTRSHIQFDASRGPPLPRLRSASAKASARSRRGASVDARRRTRLAVAFKLSDGEYYQSDGNHRVCPEIHAGRRADGGAPGVDAARRADADPDRAIEDWLDFARELGASHIQLSAALHPSLADVPPEAMLDPVANTLDLRAPFDAARAKRVCAAMKASGVGISDLGYFDNLLHHDRVTREKKRDFLLKVLDAAVLLGVNAVCGFVGRNQQHSMDENLVDFEEHFVPILKAVKERGLTYRVEQCPMPGWTTGDNWHNNIAYTPGAWIALHRICERHGVGDQFRIHYDPSHAILMGQDTRAIFQFLKDSGYAFLIGGFHVKGQVVDAKGVAAWGYGGQTMERGDWIGGSRQRSRPINSTRGRSKWCSASTTAGTARHDPLAYLQNRTVDWLDHQLAARELLPLDIAKTHLVVEHE